jgi:hypothetical protein
MEGWKLAGWKVQNHVSSVSFSFCFLLGGDQSVLIAVVFDTRFLETSLSLPVLSG